MHTHPHAERALVRARRVQFSSVRARSYGRPNCAARASRSPFVHSDADFVPRLGMPRRPEGAAPRKRGRPRLADDMISKAGFQKRRQRDPNEHAMTALHVALPKPVKEPGKRGRPRKPWKKLTASGRRKREQRRRLTEQHMPLLLLPLLVAAAGVDPEEAARQDAEQEAARVAAKKQPR